MTMSAKIVADSISINGIRLTTMELNYPRFIHSEFMTHRVFSRNAASSRAIPIEKMLKQVQENPAMPVHWGKNQPGMQAREEIENSRDAALEWKRCAIDAVESAEWLSQYNLHKQIVNRVLEPFQYIKVIVTATEWYNFFKLRLHKDAQPEIQELAHQMKKAMVDSSPKELIHGEWHLPYIQVEDCTKTTTDNFVKLSVARCARVSYLNHDNSSPSVEKDIALYNKLLEAGHMSPFEHVATPMRVLDCTESDYFWNWEHGVTHCDKDSNLWSGNFKGFLQFRQLLQSN